MDDRKSAGLAGLLNGIFPGLGYLYVGKPVYAFILPLSMLFILGVFAWSKIIFLPQGFLIALAVVLLVLIFGIASAVIIARNSGPATSRWFQSWYGYLGFIVIMFVINSVATENRGLLFGYETHRISSPSMKPAILTGDFIISNTFDFKDRDPLRGEVVIFTVPRNSSQKYAKRVIGIPGDVLEIVGNELQVNGETPVESYTNRDRSNPRRLPPMRVVLPKDSYFLLGDYRDRSRDSRDFGAVSITEIHGSVKLIWFSFDPDKGVRNDRIGKRLNIN